ncbi:MAG: serine/threonine protein kinase, partial [Chitinophagaceae bacterium]
MVNAAHFRLNAADRSYFAILKKEVHALAVAAQFSARRLGEIDIIVAEMVSNLAKHAGGGELFVKLIEEKGLQGIEIISIDSGPGIGDLRAMMQDGATTKNTLGQGLGAIRRLSHHFQVYTQKGWGTILLCRIFTKEPPVVKEPEKEEIRSFVVPKPGEVECGDGFYYKKSKEHIRLFLGDGLGHGKEASIAVQKAIEAFKLCPETDAVEILRFIHLSVKRTRGLVGTVAVFHIAEQKWKVCGVG